MSVQEVSPGACAICRWASSCTFPRRKEQPVQFCEEFDYSDTPPKKSGEDSTRQQEPTAASTRSESMEEGPKGLCVDCANRPTCTYTRLEGGIWQCEEYC